MAEASLRAFVAETGRLPLSWAGATTTQDYLNFGDALSPVMVALCSGYEIERIKFHSPLPRLVAVGTIGQNIEQGAAWFWGTGSSDQRNPGGPPEKRAPYVPPPDTEIRIAATRGPVSARILSGSGPVKGGGVYGDPVWLLPRFYRPKVEKRWELGVILHLSELATRSLVAEYPPAYRRFDVSEADAGSVHLINTITPVDLLGLKGKIDEILSCRRIVSTSLHGMVIAESYGIPCLYFSPHGEGLHMVELDPASRLDLRIVDLYRGLGLERLAIYGQPRAKPTDWGELIRRIDAAWQPVTLDGDRLLDAFPLPHAPLEAPASGDIWSHPKLQALVFRHDVSELSRLDRMRSAEWRREERRQERIAARVEVRRQLRSA